MKIKILKLSIIILLLSLMGVGCERDNGVWIQIDSLEPNKEIKTNLNSIFTDNNECLLNFQEDTVFNVFYSQDELKKIDTCNTIPEINFNEYTLIVGKVMVSSISDSITSIILTSNTTKARYNLEISIHEPVGRYGAIGYLYFWRLYPKLESDYNIKLFINKN